MHRAIVRNRATLQLCYSAMLHQGNGETVHQGYVAMLQQCNIGRVCNKKMNMHRSFFLLVYYLSNNDYDNNITLEINIQQSFWRKPKKT